MPNSFNDILELKIILEGTENFLFLIWSTIYWVWWCQEQIQSITQSVLFSHILSSNRTCYESGKTNRITPSWCMESNQVCCEQLAGSCTV